MTKMINYKTKEAIIKNNDLSKKQILKKFEEDFNKGSNLAEGLDKAFANLPEDYFKENQEL
jgi:hypothetical protein